MKPLGQKCIDIEVEQNLEKKPLSNCEDWTSVELTSYGGGTMVKAGVYWDVRESVYMWSSLMVASRDKGLNWHIFLLKDKHVCWVD